MMWLERWVMSRAVNRALRRVGVMPQEKILEALGGKESAAAVEAVLNLAAGREQEARELCSARGQSSDDLRFNSGKLWDAMEFQEELIQLVDKANRLKQGKKD